MRRALWLMLGGAIALHGVAARAAECGGLAGHAPAGVVLTSAMVKAMGNFRPEPGGPAIAVAAPFCRVQGVIDRRIGFELWLPEAARWNHRLLGAGVGGDAGRFNFTDLPMAVGRGYAAATSDGGHKASDRNWMLGPNSVLVDFELRAEHRMAEVSRVLVGEFYGEPARHRYFMGCSGGGRQALKEMQRFPEDYDGILAGAPGPETAEMTVRRMWELELRERNPGVMAASDWQSVVSAAVKRCDAADGVRDGVIGDPEACDFRPAMLACPAAKPGGFCLNTAQVKLAETIYAPLRDDDGHALDAGILPGVLVDSGHSRLAPAVFGQAVRHVANWDGQGFDVSRDLAAIGRVLPELDANDPEIGAFAASGGRAILYQGWADPAVAARMTIAYYQRVEAALGPRAADTMRLFLVPGMGHCAGGAGPDRFGGAGARGPSTDPDHDLLSALDRWVSGGVAPTRLIASRVVGGRVVETRPLCAWPERAVFAGGDPDRASSFRCGR